MAEQILGGIGEAVGFFADGRGLVAATWNTIPRAAQEGAADRLVASPLAAKIGAHEAPVAAGRGRAPAIAASCLAPSAPGMYRGGEGAGFTRVPAATSAVAGLLAPAGALTPPGQPSH